MIVNQLLLLLALSTLWPGTAMPLTPGSTGRVYGMRDSDGGRVLQRSKRGWMWNQFFLLEEYTGNDHQYVGKVTCAWCLIRKPIVVAQLRVCDVASCQETDWMQSRGNALCFLGPILFFWLFHPTVCSAKMMLLYRSQSCIDLLLGRSHCLLTTMVHPITTHINMCVYMY